MKRQAISLSLNDLKKLEKAIKRELKDISKLGLKTINKDLNRIKIQFNIVNYPTKSNGKSRYCSDTWEFEKL